MAETTWQKQMIPMLRILIGDYGDEATDQVYSQTRLEEVLLVAAMYVQQEIDFDTTYTVSMSPQSISPDPISDVVFTNFMVMKAACIADQSTFRTKALAAGIKAKCGPVTFETLKHLDGFKTLLEEGPCATYAVMKDNYTFGNGLICKGILSPFSSNDFDPQSLPYGGGNYYTNRDGYSNR